MLRLQFLKFANTRRRRKRLLRLQSGGGSKKKVKRPTAALPEKAIVIIHEVKTPTSSFQLTELKLSPRVVVQRSDPCWSLASGRSVTFSATCLSNKPTPTVLPTAQCVVERGMPMKLKSNTV